MVYAINKYRHYLLGNLFTPTNNDIYSTPGKSHNAPVLPNPILYSVVDTVPMEISPVQVDPRVQEFRSLPVISLRPTYT